MLSKTRIAVGRSCNSLCNENFLLINQTKKWVLLQSSFCSEPCKWGSDSEQQCSGGGEEEEEEEDCHSWVWLGYPWGCMRGDSKREDEKTKKKIVIPASGLHGQCKEAHRDGEVAAEAGCHGES
ncbi:hypothetical protein Q3G72_034192 [Acer saccharum]|nr:hypothetical protein Q3G72_034192 [Acer saccharum]